LTHRALRLICQLLSGNAHGVAYTLVQLLGEPFAPREPETPGVTMRQVQHSAIDVAQRLLAAVVVYISMSGRYLRHQGWDTSGWEEPAQKALRTWATVAQANPDADRPVTVPQVG
jgi:hypothetical protein